MVKDLIGSENLIIYRVKMVHLDGELFPTR